ncbi:hypothetical protein FKW77_005410 [Venturia effusa]|uniref:Uncharacterized protein n=1 Tax=Venturia effusa TaxID=50376 RepID=A0A517LH85_9PEZI|nr:hypothetical protein FKW77_005410 [Venturia effusa]
MAAERRQRGPLDPEKQGTKIDFSEKYDVTSLRNKTALITGGATGIGQGIAIALAEAGVYVIIADINTTEAASTVQKLTEAGHQAQFILCDVTSWDAQVSAFKSAIAFSPDKTLDIVIPAAGISTGNKGWIHGAKENKNGDPEPISLKVLDVNLDAVFNTTHLAMYYFKKHPGPASSEKQIIFVASMGGYTSMTGSYDYCTSKWAVRGLFRSLRGNRWAMGDEGPPLRCNLIAPTFVRTPMTQPFWNYMEQVGVKMAEVSDCTDVLMRMAADENVISRAAAIAADKASFDLCDDHEGLDGGREVGLSIAENRFGYTASKKVAPPPAATKSEMPMDEDLVDSGEYWRIEVAVISTNDPDE